MTNNVVSEMNCTAGRQVSLPGTLHADNHVEHHRHGREAQYNVLGYPSATPLRQHQIGNYNHDYRTQNERSNDGDQLCAHGNGGVDIMMNPVKWIDKEQSPESQHGEEVTEYGPTGIGGYYEIQNGQSQRCYKQADRIVYP